MKGPAYHLYIIECADGSLYTGITTDVERRFREHAAGKGARYTRSHKPKRIVYTISFKTKGKALMKEMEIKSLTRHKKTILIKEKATRRKKKQLGV